METFDFIIIGYGPVGQMACAQLGQYGYSVAAFEKFPRLYGLSRAGHVDDEIVRTLQRVGAVEDFLEDAVPWEHYDMRTKAFGGDLLLHLDWSDIGPNGWNSHWRFYQNELETAIDRRVRESGKVIVSLGCEATAIAQDESGVTVTFRSAERGEFQVRGKYLLGSDGANSFVREALGIEEWSGREDVDQLVIDTRQKRPLKFEFDNGQFADPARPGCLFQLGKRHRRWEFTLLPHEKPEDFDEARVWSLLKPWVTQDDVELLRRPVYRFREKVAKEWQRDRIFLVGDAAHRLWPFTGEGMCNGIRDVSALTWRLDLVMKGIAPATLLDSYMDDRKPNFIGWMDLSREIGAGCVITDPVIAEHRNAGFFAAQKDPSLMPPLTVPPGPKAFCRANDPTAGSMGHQGRVRFNGAEGLFDDVVGRGWVLVSSGASILPPQQTGFLKRIGAVIAQVGVEGSGAPVIDVNGTYAAWLASIGRTTVLVRPDFFVWGSASTSSDAAAMLQEFEAAIRTGRSIASSSAAVTA
jgi:2-polyprenyl-6-methoxyphenol hydroxylase-like FAD-dependent oxidoreductase